MPEKPVRYFDWLPKYPTPNSFQAVAHMVPRRIIRNSINASELFVQEFRYVVLNRWF